jgi:hypothetical protein
LSNEPTIEATAASDVAGSAKVLGVDYVVVNDVEKTPTEN